MNQIANELMQVEAQLYAPAVQAQLVQFHFAEPPDNLFRSADSYRMDLCLTPRPQNARACYPQHWGKQRFELLGKLFLVPPGESMLARGDTPGKQTSLVCQLDPVAMQELLEEGLVWSDQHLASGLDVRDAKIQGLMLRLAEEARQPGFASDMLVELLSAQLCIELMRYLRRSDERRTSGGLAGWRLRLIDERLNEVGESPGLAELAELCGLSVRQLTRGFRASRGCSIGDYVADSRVEHARRLLATDMSIKAIAYSLGFASPSSFCFAFRRAMGETPGQFRQRLLKLH